VAVWDEFSLYGCALWGGGGWLDLGFDTLGGGLVVGGGGECVLLVRVVTNVGVYKLKAFR